MMDGKYTPGPEVTSGTVSATFSAAANSATLVYFDGVVVNGKRPIGIQQAWLGDSRLAMGCHAVDGTRYYIYIVNPTSTAINNVTATIYFSYLN